MSKRFETWHDGSDGEKKKLKNVLYNYFFTSGLQRGRRIPFPNFLLVLLQNLTKKDIQNFRSRRS